NAPARETAQGTLSARRRSGAGTRQSRAAQPSPSARAGAPSDRASGPYVYAGFNDHHLCEKLFSEESARGPRLTALGMQDDASGKILTARFFLSETARGYFHLLHTVLRRYGVPAAFYGDRSGIFVHHHERWTVDEQLAGRRQPTQFGRALEQLGITYIAANSPQAKGRIERLWGVLP